MASQRLDPEQQRLRPFLTGSTLKTFCGDKSTRLLECMYEHNLGTDPYVLFDLKGDDVPCMQYLHAYQKCGRDFMLFIERTQESSCGTLVSRARECNRQGKRDCSALELEALSCLKRASDVS